MPSLQAHIWHEWKNYSTKWEFDGFGFIPRGTPIKKQTDGPVLAAQTHGETHEQNDTSLARGIHKGGQPPKVDVPLCRGVAKRCLLYMGLSMGTVACIWDARLAVCRFAYGFSMGLSNKH